MKLATDTIRLLLDRPTDPSARRMAQGILELLEAQPAAVVPDAWPPASTAATPVRTAALDPTPRSHDRSGFGEKEVATSRGSTGYGYHWAPGREVQVVDPREMSVLRTIKRLRQEGVPYRRIAERLNKADIPSRSGRLWNLAMIKIQWNRITSDPELSATIENFDPLPLLNQ